jgi:predicted ATP-dependent endonuclease of OLD family
MDFSVHIERIEIENFRLLKSCALDMREQTTLLVGKNNSGKTSFVVLLEKFLEKPDSFEYCDFPISVRDQLIKIDKDTDVDKLSIRLILKVAYSSTDDISVLSEFMLDLDPTRRHANILLECKIDLQKLLKDDLPSELDRRRRFFEKNLDRKYLNTSIYAFDDYGYDKGKYHLDKRDQLVEKERKDLKNLLSFQVIHARRSVASSEDGSRGTKPLSAISTKFFRKQEGTDGNDLVDLRESLADIDKSLNEQYKQVFESFLDRSGKFLDLKQLKVVSNIESGSLIENFSQVIYGETNNSLPEQQTGLGYLNILYLLLQIEIRQKEFSMSATPLNLLIIEEPEAHTHPQMQYVFAEKIRELIESTPNLQAIITTHSSHIVSKSKFEDIRYLSKSPCESNIAIKNFHTELMEMYGDDAERKKLFKFLQQYLTINSSELFFASKAIFIEGTTERILLPWFIKDHDGRLSEKDEKEIPLTPLSSQNITVLEVGANAKAFEPFLRFMGIKTLVITDIDTTELKVKNKTDKVTGKVTEKKNYVATSVDGSTHTSNATLKYFFGAPKFEEKDYAEWQEKLVSGKLVTKDKSLLLSYQKSEGGYHPRSFEDAFISLNFGTVKEQREALSGLQNKSDLDKSDDPDFYKLTDRLISKKSDFAASVLFSVLTDEAEWVVPAYIREGLQWLQKD